MLCTLASGLMWLVEVKTRAAEASKPLAQAPSAPRVTSLFEDVYIQPTCTCELEIFEIYFLSC